LDTKFRNADAQKQERILNAAMRQFSLNGYAKASTNEIIKAAGISKGLLFHYFRNKKDLYLYLYDYAADLFVNEITERLDPREQDVFVKLRDIALIKLEIGARHPELFQFMKSVAVEDAPEVKAELEQRVKKTSNNAMAKLFQEIDFTKFKQGIDVARAMNIIVWTMEGFGNQEQEKLRISPNEEVDLQAMVAEMDNYLALLRQLLYKS
jgi:TetR/AcrR family transcriptional regulator